MLTSSAMWWDTGVSRSRRSAGMVRTLQLEREVGDGGRQVGVAGPLAVAVDAPLDLGGPGLDGGQRVGHRAPGVVVEVDAELGLVRARTSATTRSTSSGRVPPLVSHSTRASAPASSAAGRTRQGEVGVVPVAVEEVLGVEEDPQVVGARGSATESATMATASSSVVRRASTTCRSEDLATMQTTGAPASTRLARTASSSAPHAGPPGRPEGHQGRGRERELLGGPGEELVVLRVGAGPAALDEGHARDGRAARPPGACRRP